MHRRLPSLRSGALLACVPVLGLAMLASAGAASAARAPANPRAAVRAELEHLMAGWHPANQVLSTRTLVGTNQKQVVSTNWSGYADNNSAGNTYSKVAGKWTEPKITGCQASVLSAVVFWVGIDGFSTKTVEQAGTIAFCPGNGSTTPIYATWWELFPANNIKFKGVTVKPGDKIAASVVKAGTQYTFKVTDSTTSGNSFTATKACAATTCKDQSAEWIAEAPFVNGGEAPLSNFGTWTLTAASVTSGTTTGTISKFPDDEIILEDSSHVVLAMPGPLNSTGSQFTDTWKAST